MSALKKYACSIIAVILIVTVSTSVFWIITTYTTSNTNYMTITLMVQFEDGTTKKYEAKPSLFRPIPLTITVPGDSRPIKSILALITAVVSYTGTPLAMDFSGSVNVALAGDHKDTKTISVGSSVQASGFEYTLNAPGYSWTSDTLEGWFPSSTYDTRNLLIEAHVTATLGYVGQPSSMSGDASAIITLERSPTYGITGLTIKIYAGPIYS